MRVLLDTHCWLWAVTDPGRLGNARALLESSDTELYLSAASVWAMAIKYELGKLPLPEPPAAFIPPRLVRDGITPLAIDMTHTLHAASLPPLHHDPFDRVLIAQAQIEGLALVTADRVIMAYDVAIIRAG